MSNMKIYNELSKENKPILIQGAMESEICHLSSHLENPRKEERFGYSFYIGSYKKHTIIIQKTLQGMTNAAASTMLAIEHYSPALVINQGICGGHSPALHRGDILLGQDIMNYSNLKIEMTASANPLEGCHIIGCEIYPSDKSADVVTDPETGASKITLFHSDPNLLKIANACPHPSENGKILIGKIASADAWLDRKDLIALMHEKFGTCGEDMETASVAQLCHLFNIPFLSVRMLSNTRVHDEEYDETVASLLQEYTWNVVERILNN